MPIRSMAHVAAWLAVAMFASCRSGSVIEPENPSGPRKPVSSLGASHIAFVAESDPSSKSHRDGLFVMDSDGSNRRQLDTGVTGSISWSPDGRKLAYSHAHREAAGIYVVEADSGRVTRLTETDGFDGDPLWSPDGARIAFVHDHDQARFVDLAAGKWKDVGSVNGRVSELSWSRDSQWLYLRGEDKGTSRQFADVISSDWFLYRVELKTGQQERLREEPGYEVACAPEEDILACVVNGGRGRELLLSQLGGSEPQRLDTQGLSPDDLVWSPNGDRLIMTATSSGGGTANETELFLVELADKHVSRLTENSESEFSPSWSPDGKRIVFERGFRQIVVMDLEARREFVLASGKKPAWSP